VPEQSTDLSGAHDHLLEPARRTTDRPPLTRHPAARATAGEEADT
jgi:hypothetical protein